VSGIETVKELLSVSAFVVKTADDLSVIERVKSRFKAKSTFLLLGDTGVGKTQFLRSLSDAMPDPIHYHDRTELVEDVAPTKLKIGDAFIIVEDTHGHDMGKKTPNPLRARAIESARNVGINGVINVVAYGYAESKFTGEPSFTNNQPDEIFLGQMRLREIQRMEEWATRLGGTNTVDWIMTLVNKADIWHSRWTDVERHYMSGGYGSALESLIDNDVPLIVRPYASEHRRFWNKGLCDPLFDDLVRKQYRNEVISMLKKPMSEQGR
jgi:energy-coupling factor transporter ATP-binding protein EcfA2